MIILGICGASGSGKSTLAKAVRRELAEGCTILGQDCYYRDHSELSFEERCGINYDEPAAFDHDALYKDVLSLSKGQAVTKKGYDYSKHCRADSSELLQPPEVLILEGIHMFHDKRLTAFMQLKVFMHVDVDICLLRRIKRDIRDRGRSIESISQQYLQTVKPMYEEHICNYINDADFAIMQGGKNPAAISAISAYIKALKKEAQRKR